MPNGLGDLDTPLAPLPFRVWQAHVRPVQRNQRNWGTGVYSSPDASGSLAFKMKVLHPGVSRVGVRETLEVSSSPGQAGYPTSMNTGASTGYAAVGHQ